MKTIQTTVKTTTTTVLLSQDDMEKMLKEWFYGNDMDYAQFDFNFDFDNRGDIEVRVVMAKDEATTNDG